MLKLNILTPKDFINPLVFKKPIVKNDFEIFLSSLKELLCVDRDESEEHQKNVVNDFLKKSFHYNINAVGKIDAAILTSYGVEVLLECKRLEQKNEMIDKNNLNKKAFHEAILYFCKQRDAGNANLKHIIIYNAFEWFIFDAKDFDKLFWQNKIFKKIYDDYNDPTLLEDKTQYFYSNASQAIKQFQDSLFDDKKIDCVYFNLDKDLQEDEYKAIYKLLSKDVLLKEFNPNDANSLDRGFYNELLYILGLEESLQKGKKLIARAKKIQDGSFYENIINKLLQHKKSAENEIVLRLLIIWINRILFLKLLESQIITWYEDESKKFLHIKTIKDFDMLESLFFDILSREQNERRHKDFSYIPYLNSSLFEIREHEKDYLTISQLSNDVYMDYFSKTVIKDNHMNLKKGKVNTLTYLFEFLDAYDFSSQKNAQIVKEEKTLINPSVLGLIFEKINGYKDGSFYTPSYITMYMCRSSIRELVYEKFLSRYNISANSLETLKQETLRRQDDISIGDIKELIDSITIADIAVGSGHFLVSALNELIFIKNYLVPISSERNQKFHLKNDELIIENFEYTYAFQDPLQKTLFNEKRHIIENQLFGVDINPNSVEITKLRLWIELLKNAYFKEDGTIETLPNIDINIKCGNSLVSRFGLKDDIELNNIKYQIEEYKRKVFDYKEGLGDKDEILLSIDALKKTFLLTLHGKHKIVKDRNEALKRYVRDYGLEDLSDELILIAYKNRYRPTATMFEDEIDMDKKQKNYKKLEELYVKAEELLSGEIYKNALEWRFEFPEVLDENGDFKGFDLVIGNPPYIMEYQNKNAFNGIRKTPCYQGKTDIWHIFTCKGLGILKKRGHLCFIAKNHWLESQNASKMRKEIYKNTEIKEIIDFGSNMVFDEAGVQTMILLLQKNSLNSQHNIIYKKIDTIENLKLQDIDLSKPNDNAKIVTKCIDKTYDEHINLTFSTNKSELILEKIERLKNFELNSQKEIIQGIIGGPDEAFLLGEDEFENFNDKEKGFVKNFHTSTKRYFTPRGDKYILYMSKKSFNKNSIDDYPHIKTKLLPYKSKLDNRRETKSKKVPWYCLWWERNEAFFKAGEKIVWAKRTYGRDFTFTSKPLYGTANLFFIKSDRVNLKYLVALLNSKLFYFYMYERVKHTGDLLQLDKNQFLKIPLHIPDKDIQTAFISLVDKILEAKRDKETSLKFEEKIDKLVYELYHLSNEEIEDIEQLSLNAKF